MAICNAVTKIGITNCLYMPDEYGQIRLALLLSIIRVYMYTDKVLVTFFNIMLLNVNQLKKCTLYHNNIWYYRQQQKRYYEQILKAEYNL